MMRKVLTVLTLVVAAAVLVFWAPDARADVYASYVRITQDYSTDPFDGDFSDGTGAGIRFFLNDAADSVVVQILPSGGGPALATFSKLALTAGDKLVTWNGAQDDGSAAPTGGYIVAITAYSAGYSSYTEYYIQYPAIFTRGVGSVNNPDLKQFGFIYAVSGGGYVSGLARHASFGDGWGDTPGAPALTTTGEALGGGNRRYATTIDDEGYAYVIDRNEADVLRFHIDTLAVALYDTSNYGTTIQGLHLRGTGASKYIIIAGYDGVFGIPAGTQDFNTQPLDSLVTVGPDTNTGLVFWDAEWGEDNSLYVAFRADSAIGSLPVGARGVLKFDLNTGTTPKTMADAVWTTLMADGDPVTLSIWDGSLSDASDDILYMSHDVGGARTERSGIYAFTDLDQATPTRQLAYLDPEDNTTSFRGSVVVDAVGNVIYFENSNEHITLLSPPTGPNSYTTNGVDELTIATAGVAAPLLTIAEARVDLDSNNQPDLLGDTVRVIGVVNSVNIQTSNFGYFMQDDEAGIQIFAFGQTGAPALVPGDQVMVLGEIDYFRGTTEITPFDLATDITLLDTANVIVPIDLTIGEYEADAETYESRRIRLAVVHPLDFTSADWPASGSANLNVWNGYPTETTIMRIDSDTEIPGTPYPNFPVMLTGVGSQYTSSSSVHDDGYQITPMFAADFVPVDVPPLSNFALLTPSDGTTHVLNGVADTLVMSWNSTIDLNGDAIQYAWSGEGMTPISAGADTVLVFSVSDLLGMMGTADTLDVSWTVLALASPPTPVASVDTFALTLIKGAITGVEEGVEILPLEFALDQNYPNPFNPTTTIRVALPNAAFVTLKVYNMLGQEVATLVDGENKAGYVTTVWNGRDQYGTAVASGVYIYRVVARPVGGGAEFVTQKKMMMLK
jgi:flagellar hook assembly protein FlgD